MAKSGLSGYKISEIQKGLVKYCARSQSHE